MAMRWSETSSGYGGQPSAAVVRRKKQMSGRMQIQYPDYLMHYGIAGQRWGIRRYQNEDGTLTEEGKLRYNEGQPESETWNKGEAKYLTDRELQRRNNRLNQERQYKEALTTETERNAQQLKNDIIKKVMAGTLLSLAAIAMKGHWKQAASVIGKYGKQAISKLKAPILRSASQRKTIKSVGTSFNNAANRYSGLNRPSIGQREWGPLSALEIFKKRM